MNHTDLKYAKQDLGILLCVALYGIFRFVAQNTSPCFEGTACYLYSSVQRLLFGLAGLILFVKIYKKSWKHVIHTKNLKSGFAAGSGLILFIILLAFKMAIGIHSFYNTTWTVYFSYLLCLQLATGFWEELTFRAFLLEGYFQRKNATWKYRLTYACISFLFFGFIHAMDCGSISDAGNTFMVTGIFGFVFAAMYLYSHNILAPMLLHFIYDIFANFPQFAEQWNDASPLFLLVNNCLLPVSFVFMLVVSLIFVFKEPSYRIEKN